MFNTSTFITQLFFIALILGGFTTASSAQESHKAIIGKMISTANNNSAGQGIEKIYLQTDKPTYQPGDTLRFKAYLLESATLKASIKSGVMYVEITNDSSRLIKRIMAPINAITYGDIVLDAKDMPQGTYILRAYTSWMRNFDEAYIYSKPFYFSKTSNSDWLIDYSAQILKDAKANKVQLALKVNSFDAGPVGVHEMQLKLTDGKRTWFKSSVNTDIEGLVSVNFDLPEKADFKNLSLTLRDARKGSGNRSLVMPFALNRPQNIDLQFMPEGGSLVAGLPAYIAFKAIAEDGHGTEVSGEVFNSKEEHVASFNSVHKGIGTFHMLPQAGETYTAKIKLLNGSVKNFPLPAVKPSGFVLKVINPFKSDSIIVFIAATPDIGASEGSYYLMGQVRGLVFYGALLKFEKGFAKLVLNKKILPGGIVRLTLIGADKKAINERALFADYNSKLNISINSDKFIYKQRDSVALGIKVTDVYGEPVQGSFSVAVTDDGQVKIDSMKNNSMLSYMLLTSDLKGGVEDAGYYERSSDDAIKWRDLDQLLLAQGWAVYSWNDAFSPPKPTLFTAEPEFVITGRVTNAFNKPVPNSRITLFSKKPMMFIDTVTNATGSFIFKDIAPSDTAVYFIQARNKKGKSSNVGIEMDEFKAPVFKPITERVTPWYVNADNVSLDRIKNQITLKDNYEIITTGKLLKEVRINSKRIVKDSKNLNGPGEADLVIDEEQLQKAGRATLRDLLNKKVKGFNFYADKSGVIYYWINTAKVHIIIDGIDIDFAKPDGVRPVDHFNQFLDYYDAEEIKGIELMTNPSHSSSYTMRYVDPMAVPWSHAFIEVTTRSGHGPFMKKAIGTYVYRPMPINIPKQFYAPKYKMDSVPNMTDIRTTIHWEPSIVTDKDGEATISFYTADVPGIYNINIEGADLDGSIGVKRAKIEVKKR
ncbi:MAG: hypothetical protein V4520_01380 [Bacteroidota bacterium]